MVDFSRHVLGQATSVIEIATVLPSKQHVQATLAQSMNISPRPSVMEHNVEGMVPVNCVLLCK